MTVTRETHGYALGALVLLTLACGRIELASATGDDSDDGQGRRSCAGAAPTCGLDGEDCCAELFVPFGSFQIAPGVDSEVLPTTVSSFHLDKYEVTARRFRAFLEAYDRWRAAGNPRAGAGAYQWIPEAGWQERWQTALAPTAAELELQVATCGGVPFSTLAPAAGEDLPINCVTWHEALAFCLWDDARLPTEAEWIHAAAGGGEGRLYPWGAAPPPSLERAVYGCMASGQCGLEWLPSVGSKPLGAGRWTHLDLAGSMNEWVFDGGSIAPFGGYNPFNIEDERLRIVRGGDWTSFARNLRITERTLADPALRNYFWGFRCARENPADRR